MDNFSTPKHSQVNNAAGSGSVLRSRSNSSPSSSSLSTPKQPIATTKGSLVFSSNENAKKTLNMDNIHSTPTHTTTTTTGIGGGLGTGKKRMSISGSSGLLPPSSIPLPPSQQMSAKKDPSKRHSTSMIPQPSLGSRPSTPTQQSQPQHSHQPNTNTTATTTTTTSSMSSILEDNNSEILNQNNSSKVIFSNSQNTAFSPPSSTTNINTLSSSGGHMSNSSTSTPSPTLFLSTTSPPPELSLDGFSNHHTHTHNQQQHHQQHHSSSSSGSLSASNSINSNLNLNLSPSSQSNLQNHINRSSSPSPTPIGGRRTPVQMFSNNNGGGNLTPKTQPLFSDREESIQAVCRFRPENVAEQTLGSSEKQLTVSNDQTTIHITSKSSTSGNQLASAYKFSKVYQPTTTQETFYNEVGKPLIDDIIMGYNVGIIAYGQTGAGKTFSTMGGEDNNNSHRINSHNNGTDIIQPGWGITPRMMKDLFLRQMEEHNQTSQRIRFTTKVSYLEVYKEKVYDLLTDGGTSDLEIRMTTEGGFSVPDAVQSPIQNFQDFLSVLQFVEKNRKIAETKKNIASSRSHVLLIVSVLKEDLENKQVVTSCLYIVDLAGSESASKIDGKIDETRSINKSLYALGGVIEDMSKKSKSHVRYRDSKLTQLLQQCFGGNSKTCLIVNCSSSNHESVIRETIQSLNFGQRCQSVRNKPLQNVEESHSELKIRVRDYKLEIETYKKFIEKNTLNNGIISPSQVANYIFMLQTNSDDLRKRNELLSEDIHNLEEEIQDKEFEIKQKDDELKEKDDDLKEKDDHIQEFSNFFESNKSNLALIQQLQNDLRDSESVRLELDSLNNELQDKYNQLNDKYNLLHKKYEETESELKQSFESRKTLLEHIHKSKERIKELEPNSKIADELRIKLTSSLEQITIKEQHLSTLETQKQKWKSKCSEITRQSKELQDRLNILQNSSDNNDNEQIKSLKSKVIELQSLSNQAIEREKSLQKEIDQTKSKNNEQTLILINLKNQMDILTNKMEIQFPTIVNNQQQQQQSPNSNNINNNSGSNSSNISSFSSIQSNIMQSMSSIENLFEKISKNQEQTNTIISTNVESIMGKLVEIDENEEFIKKERERDSQITLTHNKSLEEAQSNFLQQQEEIKRLIKDQFKNINNNNSNNGINGSNNNGKLKNRIKNNNNNIGNNICINILFFFLILVILFFLMVGVGLTIQQQDQYSNRNSYFFKTT